MSQKASRFRFEHCVSLQDRIPPNQVFYQNICNYLYWYQMKSDSKITELSYTTRRTSDDTFEFFEFIPKMFLSCCYSARYAKKCKTYREILPLYIIFPVIIHIITRCLDPAFTRKITYYIQALFYTAFNVQKIENCVIILYTKLAFIIKMTIFKITAILKRIHTMDMGMNFTTRNLQRAKKMN